MTGYLYRRGGKRLFDLAVTSAAAIALFPVALLIALAVRLTLGSPVLFRQQRPGLHGRPFTIVKFRTMVDAPPGVSDAARLRPLGKLLRSTSLDELPELLNVLRGEMSLVGPRPLLMQYLDRYEDWQKARHDVLPGITGWAQVNGRNALTWDEKFAHDVWYVQHQSLALDLKILFATVKQVVTRHGVSAPGEATMPEFLGRAAQARPDADRRGRSI